MAGPVRLRRHARALGPAAQRPHKVRGWLRRDDDDQFWGQAAEVCDAYLRPPAGTVVICIDEKTGIQAKHRIYPERLAVTVSVAGSLLSRAR
jgi:hypothetical protein